VHPDVTVGFDWCETDVGPLLQGRSLAGIAPHGFTTRARQFRAESEADDYADLARALGSPDTPVTRVAQVHGRAVHVVRSVHIATTPAEADAIVALVPGCVVAVRTADCVPILLADQGGAAVAAIHAGWRGACGGVVRATVDAMVREGVDAGTLVAAIGPCCYQVDDRVRDSFLQVQREASSWFVPDGPGHWRLDLWRSTRDQLVAAGVDPARIAVSGLCTGHDLQRWFSYRREGAGTGRLVAAIRRGSDLLSTETV